MTFKEIYDRILPLWGETVDFSDGMVLEAKPPKKAFGLTPPATSSFYSPEISGRWSAVEDAVAKTDVYGKVMVWTLYQLIHRQARQRFEKGTFTLAPSDFAMAEVEEAYFKNLQEDAGEEELANYQRTLE